MPTVSITVPSALTVGGPFTARNTVHTSAITGNNLLLQVDSTGNVSAVPSGFYASSVNLGQTGATLLSLITASSAGVSALNAQSGVVTIVGVGSVTVTTQSQQITISGGAGGGGDVTASQLASTGQQAWLAAQNNSVNLSGNLAQTGSILSSRIDSLSGYAASAASLTQSGVTLWNRDTSISGGLQAQIDATGAATINYASSAIASSGQQAWSAAHNNAVNLSGNLTQTGIALFQRDASISGGLQAQIFATGSATVNYASSVAASSGQQAWSAAQNNAVNLSGNLTQTGLTLFQRDSSISGDLQAQIAATGAAAISFANTMSAVKVTGSATIAVPNFSGIGGTQVIQSGNFILVSGGAAGGVTQIQLDSLSGWSASASNLTQTGATLLGLISAASAGVASINGSSGVLTIAGAGNVSVTTNGQTITVSGNTGAYSSFATTTNLASTGQQAWSAAHNNAVNLSGNLTQTGITLFDRDTSISGGLEIRIFQSGAAAVIAANAIIASTGQQTWLAAQNNAVNLSGNLTQTGTTLWNRDVSISGGLEARIFSSGTAGISYADATFATKVNLTQTGITLWDRDVSISGGLEARIFSSGAAAVSHATTISNANSTNLSGNLAQTGIALWNRDASISGGLEVRIFSSGAAASSYATIVANSNATNLSGDLTQTGITLWNRDSSISGGLQSQIAATGAATISYGDTTFATKANLTQTGATLWQRDIDISGALAAQIAGGGSVVKVSGSSAIGTADFTGVGLEVSLVGASTIAVSTYISVSQASHGFSPGTVIRSAGTANQYLKALADNDTNAEVVGYVVESGGVNSFKYITEGIVTAGVPSVAPGTVMFLSAATSGALSASAPSGVGQISKPLMVVVESGARGTFFNMRGSIVTTGNSVQTVWVPAAAMLVCTTSGAAAGTTELGPINLQSGQMLSTLDFDAGQVEFTQFDIGMPKSWNEGTVTSRISFTCSGTTGSVVWGIQGTSFGANDPIGAAWGVPQLVTGHILSGNWLSEAPESSAIAIAGTPQQNDWVKFRIYRSSSDSGDTLGVDAKLIGAKILMTLDSNTDA